MHLNATVDARRRHEGIAGGNGRQCGHMITAIYLSGRDFQHVAEIFGNKYGG